MNKKYIFIIVLLLSVFVFGAVIAKGYFIDNDNPTKESLIIDAITQSNPELLHNDKPVIEIDSISTFNDGWYIVTIKSVRATGNIVPVKVVVVETDNVLKVIAGPDTHFKETDLLGKNLPDSVILELSKP